MTDAAFPVPGILSMTTAAQWEDVFTAGLGNGVIPGNGSGLAGSLDTAGRNAVIGTGAAIIQAYCKPISAPTSTPIPAPSTQNRIDRLVLRLDRSQTLPANWIVPTVITGAPGASPQEPPLQQTPTGLFDLPIFSWTSTSAGALVNPVPEQYFIARVLSGLSTARPSMSGPGILLESDTGAVAMWNGSGWQYIIGAPDTWHGLNLNNGFSGNVAGENQPSYTLVTISGIARGVAFYGVMDTPSNAEGKQIAPALPAAYQPSAGNARWPVSDLSNENQACHLVLNGLGQIIFRGPGAAGDQIDISGTAWMPS
jgi:hypothetical protein